MNASGETLARIQTWRYLEEINHFVLHDEGEIIEVPGKISLVWTDPVWNLHRFLAVKVSGEDQVLVNGRPFPASEEGLKQGLLQCLIEDRKTHPEPNKRPLFRGKHYE